MANQRRQEARTAPRESPLTLLLTGVVCLGIGLGIGYYFGRQNADLGTPTVASQTQSSAPSQGQIQDPAAFVQSEAALKTLLSTNPNNLDALTQLGNLYYDHGQYQQAIDWYGKALDIDPRNPNVRTDRGTCYWNLNQPDAALAEFQKSLEVNPSHAQTLYNMGVVYLHGKNDPEGARKAWERLLASNPNYPDRAKVEQQLSSLAAQVPAASTPVEQKKAASPGMEDLLDRMKSRP